MKMVKTLLLSALFIAGSLSAVTDPYEVYHGINAETERDDLVMRDVLIGIYDFLPTKTQNERDQNKAIAAAFKAKFGVDIASVPFPAPAFKELQNKFSAASQELEKLDEEKKQTDKEVVALESALKQAKDTASEEQAKLSGELEKKNADVSKLEQELAQAESDLKAARNDAQSTSADLSKKISTAEASIKDLTAELAKAKREAADQLAAESQAKAQAQEEARRLEREISAQKEAAAETKKIVDQKLDSLKKGLADAVNASIAFNSAKAELEDAYGALKNAISSDTASCDEVESLQNALANVAKEFEAYNDALSEIDLGFPQKGESGLKAVIQKYNIMKAQVETGKNSFCQTK